MIRNSNYYKFRNACIDTILYGTALAIIAISLAINFAYGIVPALVFFAACCMAVVAIIATILLSISRKHKEANNG